MACLLMDGNATVIYYSYILKSGANLRSVWQIFYELCRVQ